MPEKILKIPERRKVLFEKFNFDIAIEGIIIERLDGCEIIRYDYETLYIKDDEILLSNHDNSCSFYFRYKNMWGLFYSLNDSEEEYDNINKLFYVIQTFTTNWIQKNLNPICSETSYLSHGSSIINEKNFEKNKFRQKL